MFTCYLGRSDTFQLYRSRAMTIILMLWSVAITTGKLVHKPPQVMHIELHGPVKSVLTNLSSCFICNLYITHRAKLALYATPPKLKKHIARLDGTLFPPALQCSCLFVFYLAWCSCCSAITHCQCTITGLHGMD